MPDAVLKKIIFGDAYPFDVNRLAELAHLGYEPTPEKLGEIGAGCTALLEALRRDQTLSTSKWEPDVVSSGVTYSEVSSAAVWLEQSLNPDYLSWGDDRRKKRSMAGWPSRVFSDLVTLRSWFDHFLEQVGWKHHCNLPEHQRRFAELQRLYKERNEPIPSEVLVEYGFCMPGGLNIPPVDLRPLELVQRSLTQAVTEVTAIDWREKPTPSWGAEIEARNKWIYDECCRGTAYSAIILQLKKMPPGWRRISTPNGLKDVAKRYAKFHNLPSSPTRQGGRKPIE